LEEFIDNIRVRIAVDIDVSLLLSLSFYFNNSFTALAARLFQLIDD